ncbi:hypothetical protein D3C85_1898010 [compost metagenome]
MGQTSCLGLDLCTEADGSTVAAHALIDDCFKTNKCTTNDEQDVLGVDDSHFRGWILATTLWANANFRAFDDLQ